MSNYRVVAVSDDNRFRACIEYDESPMNPRTDYDTGTWFTAMPSSDGLPSDGRGADYEDLYEKYYYANDREAAIGRLIWLVEGRRVVFVDASHTRGFLIEDDERLAEVAGPNGTILARDVYLNRVADDLVAYCEGDVYGVIIEKALSMDADGNGGDWESVESCWGFIGSDYAENEAKSMLATKIQHDRAPQYGQLTIESEV